MKRAAAMVLLFLMEVLAAWSQASTRPYAQMLVNETVLRNPNISMLSIAVRNPTNGENRIIASNRARAIDSQAGNDALQVFVSGRPMTTLDAANHRCQALVPLHDVSETVIGTLSAEFISEGTADDPECLHQAGELRDELSQVIPSVQTLFDPFIVSTSPNDVLAQRLTIETLAKYPDVLVLALHVTAPGESVNKVVGINQPKFLGRASDEVDHEVSKTGKTIVQVIPATHRMETHMPLRAADGSLVGTVVTVYLWRKEAEAPELMSRSMRIRDELQPRIPSLAALVSRVQ
jgi:hypothetical protein